MECLYLINVIGILAGRGLSLGQVGVKWILVSWERLCSELQWVGVI